jgi:hypothetical protein
LAVITAEVEWIQYFPSGNFGKTFRVCAVDLHLVVLWLPTVIYWEAHSLKDQIFERVMTVWAPVFWFVDEQMAQFLSGYKPLHVIRLILFYPDIRYVVSEAFQHSACEHCVKRDLILGNSESIHVLNYILQVLYGHRNGVRS